MDKMLQFEMFRGTIINHEQKGVEEEMFDISRTMPGCLCIMTSHPCLVDHSLTCYIHYNLVNVILV